MSIFFLSEIRHLFQTTGIPEVEVGTEGLSRKGDLENSNILSFIKDILGYVLLAKLTITNLACSTILMNTDDKYLMKGLIKHI